MDFVVWRAASLLLVFPDQRFYDRRPMLRAAVADLPDGVARRCLDAFLDHVDRTPPIRMLAHYLEICREGRLLLTQDDDDARRRSVRARLAGLYRDADWDFEDGPEDSLPSMLEYAALCADDWLLREHRAALERLHRTLEADGTPYAVPVEAVRATLAPHLAPPAPPLPAPQGPASPVPQPEPVRRSARTLTAHRHDEGRRIINV
ncbi:nitrate reductase molybdenum cofactor assembly chaperone [Actinomadura sp. 9N407]|uniref:nitrate reductase molybdenum cofactor assembly chaperone n=1 Tax=Actinomadura sp. 9N407 TaxID=3375154 RepID=UPI0037970398